MAPESPDGLAAVIEAAREGQTPVVLDPSKPTFVVVPDGVRPVEVDMTKWQSTPARVKATYRPATVDAFSAYVKRNSLHDYTTVWVHPTSGRIVAVIDDSGPESPGWGEHKVVLELETTPEWNHWLSKDGILMGQEEFAEHVEVGLDDIQEPSGADVLEMAQTFHAKTNSTFRQATRLASGETQFQYDEEIQAKAGATGTMEIPSVLMLGLAPFVGEKPYKVIARVRYRISSGRLSLGYKLDRPDLVRRDALDTIAEKLGNEFPLTYVGSEPA
jgi:uncharacterized protein YfdQ (DUF2303 family)